MAKRKNFRSAFEQKIAQFLEDRGIKYEYEPKYIHYDLPMHNSYCAKCSCEEVYSPRRYLVDFVLPNGIHIEAKGEFTSKNRKKMEAIIESNPDLDIRMVFMRNNYLSKKHANTYADWCERKGIAYAVGNIPEKWLND